MSNPVNPNNGFNNGYGSNNPTNGYNNYNQPYASNGQNNGQPYQTDNSYSNAQPQYGAYAPQGNAYPNNGYTNNGYQQNAYSQNTYEQTAYNPNPVNAAVRSAYQVTEKAANTAITRTYGLMALGLLVSFGVAYLSWASGIAARFYMASGIIGPLVLFAAIMMISISLSAKIQTMKVGTAYALFFTFAALMGLDLSSIFFVYSPMGILAALALCSVFFLALTMIGLTTRKNMLGTGKILMTALIVLIVAQVVISFLPFNSSMMRLICLIGVALFSFMTVRDAQMTRALLAQVNDEAMLQRVSILAALNLFLDFINLFQYLLYLFNSSDN